MTPEQLDAIEHAARWAQDATNDPASPNYWPHTDKLLRALLDPATVLVLVARARRADEVFDRAFAFGFLSTAEGFNGECAYDHCAPSNGQLDEKAPNSRDFIRLREVARAKMEKP